MAHLQVIPRGSLVCCCYYGLLEDLGSLGVAMSMCNLGKEFGSTAFCIFSPKDAL